MSKIAASFDSSLKRKIEVVTDDEDLLQITPLGAGNEVGRSCIVLKFKGKTVMVSRCSHLPATLGCISLFFSNKNKAIFPVISVPVFVKFIITMFTL